MAKLTNIVASVAEPDPEPHRLVGAGAVTRCGSGSAAPAPTMLLNMVGN
jgi:hypothetical protein